jgi:alpha-ketoglutaric semialdehyde dehydrogenase
MGPVCGRTQMETILAYIDIGIQEGAKLIAGGRRLSGEGMDRGCFIEPSVFSGVSGDMKIARQEIFGPVLCLIQAQDFEQAVEESNAVDFGLSSSIFTASLKNALTFVNQTRVGLTHVNLPTSHKEPQASFGGIKHSGIGLPEAGKTGIVSIRLLTLTTAESLQ